MNKTNKTLLTVALVLLAAFGIYALVTRPRVDQEATLYVQDLPAQQVEQIDAASSDINEKETQSMGDRVSTNSKASLNEGTSSSVGQCRATDVEGNATLQTAGTGVIGTVIVSTREGITCSVSGNPFISISDNGGVLSIQQNNVGANTNIVLKPGEKAVFRTTWSNWCGRKTSALSYRVTLPGDSGYLLVPAISTNGQVQTTAPLCTNIQGPSVVSVTAFSR